MKYTKGRKNSKQELEAGLKEWKDVLFQPLAEYYFKVTLKKDRHELETRITRMEEEVFNMNPEYRLQDSVNFLFTSLFLPTCALI